MTISLFITYLIIINLFNIFWMSMSSIVGVIFLITYIKMPYKKESLVIKGK